MSSRLAACAVAGLLGGWSPLAAQEPTSAQVTPPPPTFTSSVVVTASLEPRPAREIPAVADVVDAEQIERRQANQVVELLRTLPGTAVTQSGSPGKVASLFVRGASSAQTLVVLDGVTLNDPVLGAFDWSATPTEGLERVEVARGPFSALWGSGAVGGVVQLVTRATGARSVSTHLEAGSHDYRRGALSAAAPLGPVALALAGHLRRGEGELANDFYDGEGGRLRADWTALDGLRIGLSGQAGAAHIGIPYDFSGAPSPAREQRSRSGLLALPADWTRGDWSVQVRLASAEGEIDLEDADDPFAASAIDTEREQARATATWNASESFWVAGGAERGRELASTASAFGPGLDGARATTEALFAQAGWSGRRLRVEAGARHDDHSAFGAETSLRGGAVLALSGRARLRASYGESFRAPALGDLYFPSFGNPDLQPETSTSVELGLEGELGAWSARLAAFRTDFEDLIQFDLVTFVPGNIGRARAEGVEATLEARAGAWLGRLDATWLDATDRATGAPLPRRPEWSAALVADHTGARFGAGATVRYVGAREDVGRVALGDHTVVDLRASFTATAWLSPYARIENLFDAAYEEAAGFPAPGRGFAAGVALRSPR
ncbi:MAG: TonB-dependent vitamin receptor [Acidobacteria bacterium]|nr:TonB-dependent vitamin receptor [Acidobacteriota bacterium]